MKMFEKTFQHYHQILDDLTSRIVKTSTIFKMNIENSDAVIEVKIAEAQRKFEKDYKEASENHKASLEAYEKEVEKNLSSFDSRLDDESNRLIQHYEKLFQSKTESLVMTESAYEKAKSEVDSNTKKTHDDITAIVNENNEILRKHRAKMMETLVEDDQQINELQNQVDKKLAEQQAIAPDLEKQWRQREEELMNRFQIGDHEYQSTKENALSTLESTETQLNKYKLMIQDIQRINEEQYSAAIEEFEKKLKDIIERRNGEIEGPSKERKEKYKAKIAQLRESLDFLEQQSKNDQKALKDKMANKAESHQERLKNIDENHKKVVSKIIQETNDVKKEIEDRKIEWEIERKNVIDGYKQDLVEIQQKADKEQKYYDMKYDTLRQELHHVLQENQKILNKSSDGQSEFTLLELKHQEEEAQLSARLAEQFQAKVNERIKAQMSELKQKHNQERDKIIAEINSARNNEAILQTKYNEANDSLNELERSPSTIISGFTSSRFLEAQTEKWREAFFVDCKLLKEEEANALKALDNTKIEFKEAVQKTIVLKEKLTSAAAFYATAVEESRGKNEEELKEMKDMLLQKEKEIADLERQFEENEKELHKRTRQIEQAEDKLSTLRNQLANEKTKIQEKLKKEYQPIIKQEQRKAEMMVNEIEKLRNELELAIEFTQNDLFVVEASNTAMAEGLQKETEHMVNSLKEQIAVELRKKEEEHSEKLAAIEAGLLNDINIQSTNFALEEHNVKTEYEKKVEEQRKYQTGEISKLNDECMNLITINSEKKEQIVNLGNRQCSVCPVLERSIKKFEKQMIQMQEEVRELTLDDQNKTEMYNTFHRGMRKALPPLTKQAIT
ncbi:hypothetical protein TRFO_20135 [Tritrichomonas foetus]|uniref:Uncharacterized protein n=1 Tax=Tritrichomonas foetus TaxID=1144522 RepID=A0A1J4KGL4_9EUKA|nr:hypothetical protein TRFO_20135 [Tritrichomonas foetus]|eukprot:OHT10543.1 hypothetical protein TRFO_20135 [Tritrichomonas foetus]